MKALLFEAVRAPKICRKPARWLVIKVIIFSEFWQFALNKNEKGHIASFNPSWGIIAKTPRKIILKKSDNIKNFLPTSNIKAL